PAAHRCWCWASPTSRRRALRTAPCSPRSLACRCSSSIDRKSGARAARRRVRWRRDRMKNAGQREPNVIPGFGITLGFTTFFLCAIVLLPLSALVLKAGGMDFSRFLEVITSDRAVASYRLSFGAALLSAGVNMVFGFV